MTEYRARTTVAADDDLDALVPLPVDLESLARLEGRPNNEIDVFRTAASFSRSAAYGRWSSSVGVSAARSARAQGGAILDREFKPYCNPRSASASTEIRRTDGTCKIARRAAGRATCAVTAQLTDALLKSLKAGAGAGGGGNTVARDDGIPRPRASRHGTDPGGRARGGGGRSGTDRGRAARRGCAT